MVSTVEILMRLAVEDEDPRAEAVPKRVELRLFHPCPVTSRSRSRP